MKKKVDWEAYRQKRNKEYESEWYARIRKYVFARDNFTCTLTGARGVHLQMHHIKPYARNPKLRYNSKNLVTLSRDAHELITGQEDKYAAYLWKIVQERERAAHGKTNS